MKHFRRWGAVYILVALWLSSWGGYFLMETLTDGSDSKTGWVRFVTGTFENQQSEAWFGVIETILIIGLAHKIFKRSEESQDRIEAHLQRIEERLGQMDDHITT